MASEAAAPAANPLSQAGDTSKAIDNFVDRKAFNPRAIATWRYWYEG
jgi:hypothetical protein